MTCEICVMNRHAAVLAADSASTVTRWVDGKLETRYFKGANKIFQLSHYQPIGLMIFNSVDLLQVPWEILIKGFRDELSEKTFNNLDGYAEEFFAFLDGNTRFFPESVQNDEFFAAAQRAAIELVFSVVDHTDKLKEADNIARLEAAIVARGKALDAIAFPKRITADHEQRAIGKHADAVAEKLAEFFELPQDLRKTLAALSIRDASRDPPSCSLRPASYSPDLVITTFFLI
jgi:hypothetical protein